MNPLNRVNLSVVLYSILLLALIAKLDSLFCFCSMLWWGVFVCSTISTTTTPRLIKIIFQYVLSSSRFSRFVIIASRLVSFYQFLLDSDVRASDCFHVTIGKELAEFIATFTATILTSSCRSLSVSSQAMKSSRWGQSLFINSEFYVRRRRFTRKLLRECRLDREKTLSRRSFLFWEALSISINESPLRRISESPP